MQATEGGLWAARLDLPAMTPPLLMAAIENLLEPEAFSVSRFERRGGAVWRIEAIFEHRPNQAALARGATAILKRAAKLVVQPVRQRDWLAEIQRQMPAVRAGRFWVAGSHVKGGNPRGTVRLVIDAGLAFGTGHHETTRGCLLALDRLARSGRRIRRPLDLGCGTAVLAMAAAYLWDVDVLAADNDPAAVTVARAAIAANGYADRIRAVRSEGYRAASVRSRAPYDLVIANILAGPLIALADGLARNTKAGSVVVLAGLLAAQEQDVLATHERYGFRSIDRHQDGDWPVLVLERGPKRKRRPQGKGRRL